MVWPARFGNGYVQKPKSLVLKSLVTYATTNFVQTLIASKVCGTITLRILLQQVPVEI